MDTSFSTCHPDHLYVTINWCLTNDDCIRSHHNHPGAPFRANLYQIHQYLSHHNYESCKRMQYISWWHTMCSAVQCSPQKGVICSHSRRGLSGVSFCHTTVIVVYVMCLCLLQCWALGTWRSQPAWRSIFEGKTGRHSIHKKLCKHTKWCGRQKTRSMVLTECTNYTYQ